MEDKNNLEGNNVNLRQEKLKKIALFLISVGEQEASKILSLLDDTTIEELMVEVAKINKVSPKEREEAILEFGHYLKKSSHYTGGIQKAEDILKKSLGGQKAEIILEKVRKKNFSEEIAFFNRVEASILAQILNAESPQVTSVFLSILEPKKSAEILKLLPKSLHVEIASRIANTGGTHPDIIQQVCKIMKQKVSERQGQEFSKAGGTEVLANILNHVDKTIESSIINSIEETSPEIAGEIKERLYSFEDILKLNSKEMRILLSKIDINSLPVVLRGADTQMKEHFFSNLSKNRVNDIIDTMDNTESVPISEINNSRNAIIEEAKKLEEEKKIIIKKEKEEFI